MWTRIERCNLIPGRVYNVLDKTKYVWKAMFDGEHFVSKGYKIHAFAVWI